MAADHGPPIAWTALREGTRVLDATGEDVGAVEHVLADVEADVWEGLVVDTRLGPGGLKYADHTQVASLHEGAVVLSVAADRLAEPSENPAVLGSGPDDTVPDGLGDRLKRAWDWVSGRY